MSIIGGALAGGFSALADVGKEWMRHLNAADIHERAAEIQRLRDERLADLREQADIRAEERKREPYQRAAQTANERIAGGVVDDSGMAFESRAPSQPEEARIRAGAYDEEGLAEAGSRFRTEALSAERLDLEREKGERADRRDTEQHSERLAILNRQLANQEKSLARQYALDRRQSTAMTINLEYLVANGIAKDPSEAFERLRAGVTKSPESAIAKMTDTLLKSGDRRYRGQEGRALAVDDARSLIGKINAADEEDFEHGFESARPLGARRGQGTGAQSSFSSAEEVRAAHRAGRIDRATAIRELQRFGYE